jgi:hypothetical protein
MDETPRENWATYLGAFTVIIPGLFASGFMPAWNVLPFAGWLAIATVGTALAGVVATPRWIRGAFAGAITGAGAMLGLWLYVVMRVWFLGGHNTFLKLELTIGAMIGAMPGLLLYGFWARQPPQYVPVNPSSNELVGDD